MASLVIASFYHVVSHEKESLRQLDRWRFQEIESQGVLGAQEEGLRGIQSMCRCEARRVQGAEGENEVGHNCRHGGAVRWV